MLLSPASRKRQKANGERKKKQKNYRSLKWTVASLDIAALEKINTRYESYYSYLLAYGIRDVYVYGVPTVAFIRIPFDYVINIGLDLCGASDVRTPYHVALIVIARVDVQKLHNDGSLSLSLSQYLFVDSWRLPRKRTRTRCVHENERLFR